MKTRRRRAVLVLIACQCVVRGVAGELPLVFSEDVAGLTERATSAVDALAAIDAELAERLSDELGAIDDRLPPAKRFILTQQTLDAACLLGVAINPESRVKVSAGPADHDLVPGKVKAYLVKVHNQAGVTAPLRVSSPQASAVDETPNKDSWLTISMHRGESLPYELTGALLEYRVVQLQTESVGDRSAVLAMDVGQGTADIGFRNDVLLTFRCGPPRVGHREPSR